MLPKKYHAIIFISILVMLLLLGLHLLGIGYSGTQAAARSSSAALARNSTLSGAQTASSSSQQLYRHPIVYDKLTGATNNQISEVLGSSKPQRAEFPIDHYQQQQQQQQPANPHQLPAPDDFFGALRAPGFPPQLRGPHQMAPPPPPPHHLMGAHLLGPPPPRPMTTQAPAGLRGLQAQLPAGPQLERESVGVAGGAGPQQSGADSLPSASSLNNNGARSPQNNTQQQQQQQQQQPVYYTPPIFAYNQFDQNNNPPLPYGFPQQQQQPPLGVPEPPLSLDEYNARQARLRQIANQHHLAPSNEMSQTDRYGGPKAPLVRAPNQQEQAGGAQQQNLLAEPHQQQRHKQQMLDRQLLFGASPAQQAGAFGEPPGPQQQQPGHALFPDAYPPLRQLAPPPPPPLQQQQQPAGVLMRAPYAQNAQAELEQQLALKQAAQNRILQPQTRLEPPAGKPAAVVAPTVAPEQLRLASKAGQTRGGDASAPACARVELPAANLSGPALFCQEDADYPKNEIMRALENYATERSIELLLPQQLVQMQLSSSQRQPNSGPAEGVQQQLALDSLQPSIANLQPVAGEKQQPLFDQQQLAALFPSANYEPMCRSSAFMAQPKRAKNLFGQWKVVVNLPGLKYRGIAVSQMVRLEQCSRPMAECAAPPSPQNSQNRQQNNNNGANLLLGKSRCLQHYENQRLLAWSHQQGLHLDIFRLPVACSCHIHRR